VCGHERRWIIPIQSKKVLSLLYSPPPISLHGYDLSVKETFDMSLEIMKLLKDFRFMFKQVNSSKLAKIIKKTNIITMISNRRGGRTRHEKTPNVRAP
jgi:hypothetical protein